MVIANRGVTSATRILTANCPDRNGDGVVRTSTGGGDVLAWGEDECIAWHTPFGNASSIARGTVVEERAGLDGVRTEVAWVGAWSERKMYEIDTADGELTGRTVNVNPVFPYGAALASNGKVWVCGDAEDELPLPGDAHPRDARRAARVRGQGRSEVDHQAVPSQSRSSDAGIGKLASLSDGSGQTTWTIPSPPIAMLVGP